MILLIDNYDSFTYNLVQYFQCLNQEIRVHKNNEITIKDIESINPEYIVISPGPNAPDDAGISLAAIETFFCKIPILGVCLGHQCIAQAFGAKIIPASEILHGKTSKILHNYQGLFQNIPNKFKAARYHSLVIDMNTLPNCIAIDAWDEKNTIMAISHRIYPLYGIQFHPESILSEHGLSLLSNFLNCTGAQNELSIDPKYMLQQLP